MEIKRVKNIDELNNLRLLLKDEVFQEDVTRIRACCGTACMATGSEKVIENIELEAKVAEKQVELVETGCQGLCQKGPVMKVEPYGYFYQKVKQSDAHNIVSGTVSGGYAVRNLLYRHTINDEPIEIMDSLPFYKKQLRIALRNNGRIDPLNIYHYLAVGGYAPLAKALSEMTPD